jgi:uncharacterized protein YacL
MKIPGKYYNIVFSCLAAIVISVPIAFIMVVINLGFTEGFGRAFLKSALVSVIISIPLANIGIPVAQKTADKIVKKTRRN